MHSVSKNIMTALRNTGDERSKTHFELSDGRRTEKNKPVFVCRFFSNGFKRFNIANDGGQSQVQT